MVGARGGVHTALCPLRVLVSEEAALIAHQWFGCCWGMGAHPGPCELPLWWHRARGGCSVSCAGPWVEYACCRIYFPRKCLKTLLFCFHFFAKSALSGSNLLGNWCYRRNSAGVLWKVGYSVDLYKNRKSARQFF